ncbi:MAG: hypothetical protein AAGG68_31330 [Bacteroidota bacterium]
MAKKRASIFSTDTSEQEVKKTAQAIEKKVLKRPVGRPRKPKDQKKEEEKTMNLYVRESLHKVAKINAIKRDMKLGEYIEHLIREDEKRSK